MTRIISALAFITFAVDVSACDDNNATMSPSGMSTATFTTALLPSNEVPAVTGSEANGSASATITFNLTKDSAGYVTTATLNATVTATGFPAGTALTASHIHPGATGASGGVFVSLGLTPGEVTFPNGSGSFTKTGITLTADEANAILGNPGGFYLNIHTAANPNGVARGQLTRMQ